MRHVLRQLERGENTFWKKGKEKRTHAIRVGLFNGGWDDGESALQKENKINWALSVDLFFLFDAHNKLSLYT